MKEESIICDGCGARSLAAKAVGWVNVRTIITNAETFVSIRERIQLGTRPEDVFDTGDFHSLACLANWASARAELRSLDEDIEAGTTEWTDQELPFESGLTDIDGEELGGEG